MSLAPFRACPPRHFFEVGITEEDLQALVDADAIADDSLLILCDEHCRIPLDGPFGAERVSDPYISPLISTDAPFGAGLMERRFPFPLQYSSERISDGADVQVSEHRPHRADLPSFWPIGADGVGGAVSYRDHFSDYFQDARFLKRSCFNKCNNLIMTRRSLRTGTGHL